jgi:hypothetical protein
VRPSRRTAFAVIATIMAIGSLVAVIWLIHSSRHPVDTAIVYSGYLAAVAIVVTLLMAAGAVVKWPPAGCGSGEYTRADCRSSPPVGGSHDG